ncbi:MOP flippase family protein [Parasegetibacter sp. NRK P23]|uniref:MOP flippase family protein n=1 Tax=Parasegetibacter sp. NRK P23 TaxID=2942999 RepID=UPI0020432B62|nr:MOP flippase family protein [Parasegetibacter sp. NRK P23]MCM5527634.1 MOP flippase family protein [Parasegetibacter sp. NRK P23]
MSEHNIKTKAGIKWSLIDQVVRQIVVLVISGILSRLLTPSEYGLLGMATVVIGFLQVMKDAGLGASIIQRREITDAEVSTIFWFNVMAGFALAIVLALVSPLLAVFFGESKLVVLTAVLALNFALSSFGIVPDILIRKTLDFKSFFFRNLGAVLVGGVVGIALAFKGAGVWALVAQSFVTTLINIFIGFRMITWRPSLVFRISLLKSHLKFALPLLGDSSINYWVRNIDNLLVGRMLGSTALGLYTRAYTLMLLPVRQISGTLSRVMFPSFSLIQEDEQKIRDQYQKLVALIAAICFPLMAFLGVYAQEVILVVYGKGWLDVVPIFRVLCLLGALQSIGTLSGAVFSAKGKTLLMMKVGLVAKAVMIAGIVIGLVKGGLVGMAWGYLFSSMASFVMETFFVARVLGASLWSFLGCFKKETLGALIFLFTLIGGKYFWTGDSALSLILVLKQLAVCVVAFLLYVLALSWCRSSGLSIIRNNIYGRRKKHSSPDAG